MERLTGKHKPRSPHDAFQSKDFPTRAFKLPRSLVGAARSLRMTKSVEQACCACDWRKENCEECDAAPVDRVLPLESRLQSPACNGRCSREGLMMHSGFCELNSQSLCPNTDKVGGVPLTERETVWTEAYTQSFQALTCTGRCSWQAGSSFTVLHAVRQCGMDKQAPCLLETL